MTQPLSFCLAGAPKCGTTAMATYLSTHPNVTFSSLKEPYYYADDLPNLREAYGVSKIEDYEKLFDTSDVKARRGEATTLYLYSESAISNLLADSPDAKLVVMLREPLQMFRSYYQQMLLHSYEDASSLKEAWHLQDSRRRGEGIPRHCREPKMLFYRDIVSLGAQVQRLYEAAPREQVLVLFHEDLVANPDRVYRDTLKFLNLPFCGRQTFERVNTGSTPRSAFVHRMLFSSPVHRVREQARRVLPKHSIRALSTMQSAFFTKKANRLEIDRELAVTLNANLHDDIQLLQSLVSRDLSHWGNC